MQRIRLRVPREDGAILAVPGVDEWSALVAENRQQFASFRETRIGGVTLGELRALAQQEALVASTAEGIPTRNGDFESVPWIVSGHQPELFHAGVWIKNFATASLAKSLDGIGLHVLADNDILDASSIAVPSGTTKSPMIAAVAFDRFEAEVPYEERTVVDESIFEAFAEEGARQLQQYSYQPMLTTYWQHVLQSRSKSKNLGRRLAAGRRAMEAKFHCSNFEASLSTLANGEGFRRLAAELFLRADEFQATHNAAVESFRRTNRIRSKNHPFPFLEREEYRVEVPFWIWSEKEPTRQRAFVQSAGNQILVFAGDREVASIPFTVADSVRTLAEGIARNLLAGQTRWKLRPRALMTTLYLRLLLADVFLHGIGGGKYDQVTDDICKRFFAIEPPKFIILSATHYLPIAGAAPNMDRIRKLQRTARELMWNPDRHILPRLAEQSPISDWIEKKYQLLGERPSNHGQRLARFREIRSLNEKLRPYIADRPAQIERDQHELHETHASTSLLRSREFAFPLHPESLIERLIAEVHL